MKLVLFGIAILAALLNSSLAQSKKPVLIVLPALSALANAETENNAIPWEHKETKAEIELKGRLMAEIELVRTVKGKYSYTLHKLTFMVEHVVRGEYNKDALMFFVEKEAPTPESRLKTKEFWPFKRDGLLTFKIQKVDQRYVIVSIEQ